MQEKSDAMSKKLSAHFAESELACPCCGECGVTGQLVSTLEAFRQFTGRPILINSGYRCPAHNAAVGGVRDSQHTLGNAADVRVMGMSPDEVADAAERCGLWGGIGRYGTFTHLDVGPRGRRWDYRGKA